MHGPDHRTCRGEWAPSAGSGMFQPPRNTITLSAFTCAASTTRRVDLSRAQSDDAARKSDRDRCRAICGPAPTWPVRCLGESIGTRKLSTSTVEASVGSRQRPRIMSQMMTKPTGNRLRLALAVQLPSSSMLTESRSPAVYPIDVAVRADVDG